MLCNSDDSNKLGSPDPQDPSIEVAPISAEIDAKVEQTEPVEEPRVFEFFEAVVFSTARTAIPVSVPTFISSVLTTQQPTIFKDKQNQHVIYVTGQVSYPKEGDFTTRTLYKDLIAVKTDFENQNTIELIAGYQIDKSMIDNTDFRFGATMGSTLGYLKSMIDIIEDSPRTTASLKLEYEELIEMLTKMNKRHFEVAELFR